MNKGIQWWGYLHVNGTIQIKRFFTYKDLLEAESSDFVNKVTSPFFAKTREEALVKIKLQLT
jgi:hypothetical protein